MRNVRGWMLCLMLMLSLSFPILAQSQELDPLQELLESIDSQLLPEDWYRGSDVKEFVSDLMILVRVEILRTADEAAEAGAAEATRQLLPELEGWKARSQAAETQLVRWKCMGITIGIVGGVAVLGSMILVATSL